MAAGQRAFAGTTSGEIRDAILKREATPARSLNPDIDIRLQTIIEKALEKNREVRYQHASDVRADLKRLRRDADSGRAVAPGFSPAPGSADLKVGASAPESAHDQRGESPLRVDVTRNQPATASW
jgi:hypothetical protein